MWIDALKCMFADESAEAAEPRGGTTGPGEGRRTKQYMDFVLYYACSFFPGFAFHARGIGILAFSMYSIVFLICIHRR